MVWPHPELFYLCLGYDNDEALGAKMLHLSRQINTLEAKGGRWKPGEAFYYLEEPW